MKIQVSDTVMARPMLGGNTGETLCDPTPGRVVWIHPEWRYYILEFSYDRGRFRECFPLVRTDRLARGSHTVARFNLKPPGQKRKKKI